MPVNIRGGRAKTNRKKKESVKDILKGKIKRKKKMR